MNIPRIVWWLAGLGVVGVAVAAGSGGDDEGSGGKPQRVSGPPPTPDADSGEGWQTRKVTTCCTLYSWTGKPPKWLTKSLDEVSKIVGLIPTPLVQTVVGGAIAGVCAVIDKLKPGAKRTAMVNPRSEDGKGTVLNLDSWTGVRGCSVVIYCDAVIDPERSTWQPAGWASDQEDTCYDDAQLGVHSQVLAKWATSGRLGTTGDFPKPDLKTYDDARGSGDKVMDPRAIEYLATGAYPVEDRWNDADTWVRPPVDRVFVGVVRDGDDYTLRVLIPPRVGVYRWVVRWKFD